jgi:glucan 1,6-alpha-glucosidase
MYTERLEQGYTKEEIITSINVKGRDNARRPLAWNASGNGGFTTGSPWIALNENYKEINVEAALNDSDSIFYTYQKLVQLRKENPIMVWGDFELIDTVDNVFSYYREYKGERYSSGIFQMKNNPFHPDETKSDYSNDKERLRPQRN